MAFRPSLYAIDFGTSNSLLAAAGPHGIAPPIPLDPGAPDPTILRTLLFFPAANRCFYGQDAIDQYVAHGMQGRLIRSIKKHLPTRSFVGTHIEERPMTLEDLVGVFLREMRNRANRHFDADVDRVLLGRPARFSPVVEDDVYAQTRLERAARAAGFREVHFCPEPLAAAREFRRQLDGPRIVLVADFGGGTSDFTVLRIDRDGYRPSDVLAVGGVSVAGDAFDASIMRHKVSKHFGAEVVYTVPFGSNVMPMPPAIVERICSPADASLLHDRDAQTLLRNIQDWSLGPGDREKIDRLFTLVEDALGFQLFECIEAAKRALSNQEVADFQFAYPTIELHERITRAEFERGSARQTDAILAKLDETVRQAGLDHARIDLVCSTGGTAKVPQIAAGLEKRFGSAKLQEFQHFHSVIHGLAEEARALV